MLDHPCTVHGVPGQQSRTSGCERLLEYLGSLADHAALLLRSARAIDHRNCPNDRRECNTNVLPGSRAISPRVRLTSGPWKLSPYRRQSRGRLSTWKPVRRGFEEYLQYERESDPRPGGARWSFPL